MLYQIVRPAVPDTPSIRNTILVVRALTRVLTCVLASFLVFGNTVAQADSAPTFTSHPNLQPQPQLSAEAVVHYQLTALKNSTAGGIEATFRFASPANRSITGPLSRFSRLFDNPQYRPMVNNTGTQIELVSNDGQTADVITGVVDDNGELHWYRFSLSRQSQTPYENCWMTDAVIAIAGPGRSA